MTNEVKKNDEKVFYYYLRNEKEKYYGCVAMTTNTDGTINKGISICSTQDRFVKNTARKIAYQRLIEVTKNKKSIPVLEYNGDKSKIRCPSDIKEKGCWHIAPTEKEHRILYKPEMN